MDCGAPVAVQPAAHILEDANHVLPPQSGDTRNSAEAQSEVAQKRRSERVPKRHRGMEDNSAVTDGRNGSHSPKFGKEKRRRMIRQCMGTDGDRIEGAPQEQKYEVEKILRKYGSKHRTRYLVKWVGFDDLTWEPECNFGKGHDMLLAFKEQLREENKLKYANRAARGQAGSAKKTFRGKNSKDSAALVHGIPPPLEEILWEDVSDTANSSVDSKTRKNHIRPGSARRSSRGSVIVDSSNLSKKSRRRLRHAMSRSADTGKRPRVTPKEDVCLPLEKNILATPAFDVLVPLSPSEVAPDVVMRFDSDHTYFELPPGKRTLPVEPEVRLRPSSPEFPTPHSLLAVDSPRIQPMAAHTQIKTPVNPFIFGLPSRWFNTTPPIQRIAPLPARPIPRSLSRRQKGCKRLRLDGPLIPIPNKQTSDMVSLVTNQSKPPPPILRTDLRNPPESLQVMPGPQSDSSNASPLPQNHVPADSSGAVPGDTYDPKKFVRIAQTGESGLDCGALVVTITGFKPKELAITCLDDVSFLVTYADRDAEFVDYHQCIRKIPHEVAEFLSKNRIYALENPPIRFSR